MEQSAKARKIVRNLKCCKIFEEHNFELLKQIDKNILKVRCKRCNEVFGAHLESKIMIRWDETMELCMNIYESNIEFDNSERFETLCA